GLGGLEGLCTEPVILDADDSSVPQGKDIEDLTAKRLPSDLVKRGAADSHHQPSTSRHELQRRHVATKSEPLLRCLDDLVRPVTHPILMKPLPGHVGIEYCAEGSLVAFTKAKVVEDDGFEILLTLRNHRRLLSFERIHHRYID